MHFPRFAAKHPLSPHFLLKNCFRRLIIVVQLLGCCTTCRVRCRPTTWGKHMRQNEYTQSPSEAMQQYFSQASQPSQQEILGQIVVEILREGRTLNRKSLCTKLLRRLEQAGNAEEEHQYHQLIGLLFDREG